VLGDFFASIITSWYVTHIVFFQAAFSKCFCFAIWKVVMRQYTACISVLIQGKGQYSGIDKQLFSLALKTLSMSDADIAVAFSRNGSMVKRRRSC
jgi:hypothetical protein